MPITHQQTRPATARCAGSPKTQLSGFLIVAIVDAIDLFPDNWIYIHSPQSQGRAHSKLLERCHGS